MIFKKFSREYLPLAKDFNCGNVVINNFLKNGDALDENQGITYILLSDEEDFILGYYNINVGRLDRLEQIGENSLYIPMGGTVNITYLAVDESLQHTRMIPEKRFYFGDYILHDCEKRIRQTLYAINCING